LASTPGGSWTPSFRREFFVHLLVHFADLAVESLPEWGRKSACRGLAAASDMRTFVPTPATSGNRLLTRCADPQSHPPSANKEEIGARRGNNEANDPTGAAGGRGLTTGASFGPAFRPIHCARRRITG